MGQFFTGADASFIDDKMYKLPYELIGNIIDRKDKEVDESQNKLSDLATSMLDAQGLKPDQQRLQQIKGEYEGQISDLTNLILKDPVNAATYMPKIEALKKKVSQDWKMGEVAAIQANRTAHLEDLKDWKKLQEKDPDKYTDAYINELATQSLAKFKGTNYKGMSNYSTYVGESVYGMPDMNKWVDERLKEALPNVTGIEKQKDTGKWLVKTGTTSKVMTERELNEILQRSFQADSNLQQALKQRSKFGMADFQNLLDEKGDFLPTIGFNEKGKAVRANNLVGNAFKAGLEKFGFKDTTYSETMSENPYEARVHADKLANKPTEFINMTPEGGGEIETYNGTSSTQWNAKTQEAVQGLKNIQNQANTAAMEKYGVNSMEELAKTAPTTYKAIMAGNYSVIDTPVMRELQSSRKRLRLEQNVRANTLASFQATQGGKPINWKDPKTVKLWDAYVRNNGVGTPDVKVGWGHLTKADGSPLFTGAQVTGLINQAAPLLGDASLHLPKGTIVEVKGVKYDLSNYKSVNDMVSAGIATVQQIKNGAKDTYQTMADGTEISTGQKVIFGDGKTVIDLQLNPKSLQPRIGASDSGKVQLQVNFNLKGKTHTAIIDDMSSQSLDDYNRRHSTILAGRKIISKIGNGSAELPDTGGIIYHGSTEKNVLKGATNYNPNKNYGKGWLQIPNGRGGYEIRGIDEPGVEDMIYPYLVN